MAAWLQVTLQAGICLSGNYNFFNMLTALLALTCLRDGELPYVLKSFASTAVLHSHAHQLSSSEAATARPTPTLLSRFFPPMLPLFLFAYMFTIVPSPPGSNFRITAAQLAPPPPLQHAYAFLAGWSVQFREFQAKMFHAEAAAVLTLYVALSLLSAAAATSREICDPVPSSAIIEMKPANMPSKLSASEATSSPSRVKRIRIIVSSIVSLIMSSCLLFIIITPFSWTVPLPLIPKDALQLHSITASARLSSSYGAFKLFDHFAYKPTLFQVYCVQ